MTTLLSALESVPEEYRADVERAVRILKKGGCSEVHLFGSVGEGRARAESDIDLAIRGCPPGAFFPLLGKLLSELEHSVDLIDLDKGSRLADFLQEHDLLIHVG